MTGKNDTQNKVDDKDVKDPNVVDPKEGEGKEGDQGTFKEDKAKEDKGTAPKDTDDKSDDKGKEDDADDNDEDVWGSTGDEVGDSVLKMLQEAGTTPDKAKALLWDAVQAGDATKIDRDALVEAVGKDRATLIMAGMENYTGKIAARTKEVTDIVHGAVDGADNWTAIREWAKKTLSEDEMVDYAEMIDKGGNRAKLAAKDLADQYVNAGNTLIKGQAVEPTGKGNPPVLEPLSKRDYFEAVQKLHKTGKADRAALDKLWKQRELGKAKGV